MLAELVRDAQRLGEIDTGVDTDQLVFELRSYMELANFHFVLFDEADALARGRAAVREKLDRASLSGGRPTGHFT